MAVETELKLSISADCTLDILAVLQQHPLFARAHCSMQGQRLYNIYFDTPDYALMKNGVGLRIRKMGDRRIQTLKTKGKSVNGLHQRQEWEWDVNQEHPDFALLPKEIQKKLAPVDLKQVEMLFITDFVRTTWDIQLDDSLIEVAFDMGEVKSLQKTTPLQEIELELKNGRTEVLYQLALTLLEVLPLTLENRSKAARGYQLYQPTQVVAKAATAITLDRDSNAEQSFIQIAWHCLEHLQFHQDLVLNTGDIEGIHQMRVALRRLRSLLSVYKSLISQDEMLVSELHWIAESLGNVRDWDVFKLTVQTCIQADEDSSPWRSLEELIQEHRQQAFTALKNDLLSNRYNRLLLRLAKWLTAKEWQAVKAVETLAVNKFADKMLSKYHRRLQQQGEKLADFSATQRHQLRIAVKKLGYTARFFSSVYKNENNALFIKNLTQLQETLGVLNDSEVGLQHLTQLALSKNMTVRAFLMGWYAQRQHIYLRQLEKQWKNFLKSEVFWEYR